MKISVIALGHLKENCWKEACCLYTKRIQPYSQIEIIEVVDSNPKKFNNEDELLEDEANKIIQVLGKVNSTNTFVMSLCIEAKQMSSEEFAHKIDNLKSRGISHIVFIIGASYGLHEKIKSLSNLKISFGDITMPHNLARVVLLEQLYRACKINSGEKYHK